MLKLPFGLSTERFWVHFPVGGGAAALTFLEPTPGIMFTIFFFVYEGFNDWRKRDHSYKDLGGGLFGYAAVAFSWALVNLF